MVCIDPVKTTVFYRPSFLSTIAQLNSSFKCLDTYTFTYATPTLITEALHLVIHVQLLLTTASYSELMPYTVLANCYGVSAYNVYQFQGPLPLTIMTTVAI